jgi:hypothetical protein
MQSTMTDKQKANALYGITCDEFKNEYNNPFFRHVRKLFLFGDYNRLAAIFNSIYN